MAKKKRTPPTPEEIAQVEQAIQNTRKQLTPDQARRLDADLELFRNNDGRLSVDGVWSHLNYLGVAMAREVQARRKEEEARWEKARWEKGTQTPEDRAQIAAAIPELWARLTPERQRPRAVPQGRP